MFNIYNFNFLQEFTNKNFREKLATWIAVNDQPFIVVESYEFQQVIKLCNVKAVIPSADTAQNDILNLYNKYQTMMKSNLQVSIIS